MPGPARPPCPPRTSSRQERGQKNSEREEVPQKTWHNSKGPADGSTRTEVPFGEVRPANTTARSRYKLKGWQGGRSRFLRNPVGSSSLGPGDLGAGAEKGPVRHPKQGRVQSEVRGPTSFQLKWLCPSQGREPQVQNIRGTHSWGHAIPL